MVGGIRLISEIDFSTQPPVDYGYQKFLADKYQTGESEVPKPSFEDFQRYEAWAAENTTPDDPDPEPDPEPEPEPEPEPAPVKKAAPAKKAVPPVKKAAAPTKAAPAKKAAPATPDDAEGKPAKRSYGSRRWFGDE